MGRLDKSFANVEGTKVTSRRGFFRYKKRYRKGSEENKRKQGQFHDLSEGPHKGD